MSPLPPEPIPEELVAKTPPIVPDAVPVKVAVGLAVVDEMNDQFSEIDGMAILTKRFRELMKGFGRAGERLVIRWTFVIEAEIRSWEVLWLLCERSSDPH